MIYSKQSSWFRPSLRAGLLVAMVLSALVACGGGGGKHKSVPPERNQDVPDTSEQQPQNLDNEPNNDSSTSSILPDFGKYAGGLNTYDDSDDYYSFVATHTGKCEITLEDFETYELDMILFNSGNNLFRGKRGPGEREVATIWVEQGETYGARITAYDTVDHTVNYTLDFCSAKPVDDGSGGANIDNGDSDSSGGSGVNQNCYITQNCTTVYLPGSGTVDTVCSPQYVCY